MCWATKRYSILEVRPDTIIWINRIGLCEKGGYQTGHLINGNMFFPRVSLITILLIKKKDWLSDWNELSVGGSMARNMIEWMSIWLWLVCHVVGWRSWRMGVGRREEGSECYLRHSPGSDLDNLETVQSKLYKLCRVLNWTSTTYLLTWNHQAHVSICHNFFDWNSIAFGS